ITLVSGVGGSTDNFTNTTFVDSAASGIAEGVAPFTGFFRPQEPLSNLLGLDANGTWNLRVSDAFNGDDGTIDRWSLIIGAAEPNASVDGSGVYQFRNVPDGTYDLGFAADDVWSSVSPAGTVSVDISETGPMQIVDFGIARNDVAYVQTFRDNDGDGQIGMGDGLLDSPLLFVDGNGNGQFDAGQNFTDSPNLAITDNTTVDAVQTVSGASAPSAVGGVINATHTFTGDVTMTLTGPGGESSTLIQRRGGGGDDFVNVVFDDLAPTAIGSASAPFTGTFRPETPLSVFAGIDPNGDWTLSVQDSAGGDTGILESWELRLFSDAQIAIDPDGWTEWPIIPGTSEVGLAIDEAFEYTVPSTGFRSITPDGTPQLGLLYGARRKPPTIGGKVFVDRDGNASAHATEDGHSNAKIILDSNGNGIQDFAGAFVQDTDVFIDTFFATTSTLAVSGQTPVTADFFVDLEIDHAGAGDLKVDLIAPDGTRVTLVDNVGAAGENFSGTRFDDGAETAISEAAPPFTGSFRPEQPLSTFAGVDPNGTWTLEITSNSFRDNGWLRSWGLEMGVDEPSTLTDSEGDYGFFNLEDGEYNVVIELPTDWSATGASSYVRNVNSASPSFDDLDFGIAQNDHAYFMTFLDEDGDGELGITEQVMPLTNLFYDSNDNGVFDPTVSEDFMEGLDVDIVDNTTVTSEIVIPDSGQTVADLQVEVNLEHTWISDVQVDLVAPDGTTRVQLFNRHGGNGDDLVGTRFDDAASVSIASGAAPFTGTFQPFEPLTAFDGLSTAGAWTLEITDNADGDTGTLFDWSMTVVTSIGEITASTDEDGWFVSPLVNGVDSTVGVIPIPGMEFTVPPTGLMTVTGDGTPQTNLVFGIRQEAADATIAQRAIFYGGASGSELSDDGNAESAIDTSKTPLLPGQDSSFDNYTSYILGLNGLIVDIDELPEMTTESQLLEQIEFATWDGIDVAGFVAVGDSVTRTFELLPGQGQDGSTRLKITFGDNQIQNTWLRTTIPATPETGLESADVFYVGNVIGDTGAGNTATRIRVNAADTAFIRANQSLAPNSAAVDNPFDLNRDGRVNAADTAFVRANQDLAGSVAPISAPAASTFNGSGQTAGGKSSDLKLNDDRLKGIDGALAGTNDFLLGVKF
ncbi:MAG: proprotein convertase P-domain-containing protein, partial [Planctomycetota bacterium]